MDISEQKFINYSYFVGIYCQIIYYRRTIKERSLIALQKFFNWFFERNHLTFRAGIHIGHKHPENYKTKYFRIYKFS